MHKDHHKQYTRPGMLFSRFCFDYFQNQQLSGITGIAAWNLECWTVLEHHRYTQTKINVHYTCDSHCINRCWYVPTCKFKLVIFLHLLNISTVYCYCIFRLAKWNEIFQHLFIRGAYNWMEFRKVRSQFCPFCKEETCKGKKFKSSQTHQYFSRANRDTRAMRSVLSHLNLVASWALMEEKATEGEKYAPWSEPLQQKWALNWRLWQQLAHITIIELPIKKKSDRKTIGQKTTRISSWCSLPGLQRTTTTWSPGTR